MIFLIQYNRSAGELVSIRPFEDGQRTEASDAKLELEISLLGGDAIVEVVLLEAPSEDHLRKTHRRYFETLNGLKSTEKKT